MVISLLYFDTPSELDVVTAGVTDVTEFFFTGNNFSYLVARLTPKIFILNTWL